MDELFDGLEEGITIFKRVCLNQHRNWVVDILNLRFDLADWGLDWYSFSLFLDNTGLFLWFWLTFRFHWVPPLGKFFHWVQGDVEILAPVDRLVWEFGVVGTVQQFVVILLPHRRPLGWKYGIDHEFQHIVDHIWHEVFYKFIRYPKVGICVALWKGLGFRGLRSKILPRSTRSWNPHLWESRIQTAQMCSLGTLRETTSWRRGWCRWWDRAFLGQNVSSHPGCIEGTSHRGTFGRPQMTMYFHPHVSHSCLHAAKGSCWSGGHSCNRSTYHNWRRRSSGTHAWTWRYRYWRSPAPKPWCQISFHNTGEASRHTSRRPKANRSITSASTCGILAGSWKSQCLDLKCYKIVRNPLPQLRPIGFSNQMFYWQCFWGRWIL